MNRSTVKLGSVLVMVVWIVAVCSSLASADSLQLRNGRHLQGKYVGGSTTMIGFMTSGSVEYFQTSDVLALVFDNAEPVLNGLQPKGLQPNRINGDSSQPRTAVLQRARCYCARRTAPNRSPNED